MKIPFTEDRPSARLGHVHRVDAEIVYRGVSEESDWQYHGPIWTTETRPATGHDLDPVLVDPRNAGILLRLGQNWTDEQIASWVLDPKYAGEASPDAPVVTGTRAHKRAVEVVRGVRWARDKAAEQHTVRFYGLDRTRKAEERILTTVDQDLIAEAPMIRYTETLRGGRRQRIAMALGIVAVYAPILLVTLSSFSLAAASPDQYQAAINQLAAQTLQAGVISAIPGAAILMYILMARRTWVLSIQIQPLVGTIVDPHTEAVFAVNSTKTPVANYMAHFLRRPLEAVEALATRISNFESDTIAQLMEQNARLRVQLDQSKIGASDDINESLDLRTYGRGRSIAVFNGWSLGAVLLLVTIVGAVVAAGMYAASAAGLI